MNKSIVIMGNGASLKNSGLGNKIDEFDEVVRINDWKTRGFENDAGTKTTIWGLYNPIKGAVNFISGYRGYGYSKDEIIDIADSIREIWYICWKEDNLLESWKLNTPIKQLKLYDRIKRHQSIEFSKKISKIIYPPTTGFNLICTMSSIYDKIYLAGFDFAGTTQPNMTNHHYYGKKKLKDVLEREIHNPHLEYEIVKRMIGEGKIEFLTQKTKIIKGNFIGGHKLIGNCESCGRPISLYDWEQLICNYCENEI